MSRFFSNKRYEDIMREIESDEEWAEFDEAEESFDEAEMPEAAETDADEEDAAEADAEEAETEVPVEAASETTETKTEEIEYTGEILYEDDLYEDYDDEEEEDDEDEDAVYEDDDDEEDRFAGVLNMKTIQLALAIICLCLTAVFGVSVFTAMKEEERQVAANYELIGTNLMDTDVLGGEGLLALKEAMLAVQPTEESTESSEYQETNVKADIQVKLVMTSVQKDLKIKFTNKKTGKLIANIPFEVEVKNPSGKTSTWTDEDMDGIIYMTDIASGKYSVTLVPLENKKYEKYLMVASTEKVTVKENIEYVKVDVSAEIKGENEIDKSKEEQKPIQPPVEEKIEDTVVWVESTKTYVGDKYKEINKSDISTLEVASAQSVIELPKMLAAPVKPASMLDNTEAGEAGSETATEATVESTEMTQPTEEESAEPSSEPVTEPSTEVPTEPSTEASTQPPTEMSTESTAVSSEPLNKILLKTKEGAEVFVKDGDKYRAATAADYQLSGVKFYIKEQGYKYTGWNTIDGALYYFDVNGKAVTGEQVIRGVIYHFDSNGKLASETGVLGIDVSSHNGSIDWKAVANSGVDYVIIRCGYRGYGSGVLVEDSKFRTNIQGAINAGLKVGVYFFSQALNEIEAVEEASMVLNSISGYKITFPIFLDVEYSNSAKNGRADGLNVSQRTAVCNAFCKTITNAGYRAGVYANKDWLNNHIDPSKFSSSTKIWLAQYAKKPSYSGRYEMWQYSSTGSISGISGNVDLNMSYLGY